MVLPTFTALCHGSPAAAASVTAEAAAALAPLHPPQVLVVSCGLYDLAIAQPSGIQTCWVRRIMDGGEADAAAREASAVGFDMVVEGLDEVCGRLFGEGERGAEGGRGGRAEQGTGGGVVVVAAAVAADGGVEEAAEGSSSEDSEVEVVRVVRVAAAVEEI